MSEALTENIMTIISRSSTPVMMMYSMSRSDTLLVH